MKYTAPILFLLSFLLYSQTLQFDFAYDDLLQIEHNSLITDPDSCYTDLLLEPTPPGNLYRPVTLLTYKLTFDIFGLDPMPFHLVNAVLYGLVVLLCYFLFLPIFGSSLLAALSAALFAAHPVHVEVVSNIIGRAEILSALFGIAACLQLQKFFEDQKLIYAISSAILFLLAALSKESALVFIVLAPAWVFVIQRTSWQSFLRSSALPLGLYSISAATALFLRYQVLGDSFVLRSDNATIYAENPLFHLSFAERLIPALKVLGDYFLLMLAPTRLSADYSLMPEQILSDTYTLSALPSFAILIAVIAGLLACPSPRVKLLSFWSLVGFALTANILTPIGTIMGERLAFVPSIGFIALIALSVCSLIKNQKLVNATLIAILAVYTYASFVRIPVWKNNEVLFTQTLLDAPRSPKAKYNYAVLLYKDKNKPEEAKKYLIEAIKIHPNHIFSLKLLADIALKLEKYAELEFYLRRIIKIRPDEPGVQQRLDKLLEYKQKLEQLAGENKEENATGNSF